jgi:hypothetical protein
MSWKKFKLVRNTIFLLAHIYIFGGIEMKDYAAALINTSGAYPNVIAVNVSAPGAGDGTEFVAALVNDIWGRAQALMTYAGLTPDGVTEAAGTAQFLTALSKGYGIGPGIGVTYWKSGTPAANGDRVLLFQGQVILMSSYPLLAAAVYVGDANNPTAPAFYKTSDAGGTTRDTAGLYMVLPDARGLGLKMIGNATINARTKTGPTALGEKQEDQGQGHWHFIGEELNPTTKYGMTTTTGGSVHRVSEGGANGNDNLRFIAAAIETDGTNGTPRIGANVRDSSLGTNFGITY